MPAADTDLEGPPSHYKQLPFPPLMKSHVLHCSVQFWHPKYRRHTPVSRLIKLSNAFIEYLGKDGIVLPPDEHDKVDEDIEFESSTTSTPSRLREISEDSIDNEDSDNEGDDNDEDPSLAWLEIHGAIKATIEELGGKVCPKLNWSAPKDATFMNPTNSMDCRTPNDIYLLLKSSDFITHDLAHWDDGCIDDSEGLKLNERLQWTLMLRKHVQINPSVEFRCFVRQNQLICICQRDMNHFDFLPALVPKLRNVIQDFFDDTLRETFPDENFAFDVYIPAPHERVWLIDINPWAQRTDPLLFSWLELLTKEIPEAIGSLQDSRISIEAAIDADFTRLSLRAGNGIVEGLSGEDVLSYSDIEKLLDNAEFEPEFRIINKDDPEAYQFNSPQYSAHKMPADVVEASQSGPGPLREILSAMKEAGRR